MQKELIKHPPGYVYLQKSTLSGAWSADSDRENARAASAAKAARVPTRNESLGIGGFSSMFDGSLHDLKKMENADYVKPVGGRTGTDTGKGGAAGTKQRGSRRSKFQTSHPNLVLGGSERDPHFCSGDADRASSGEELTREESSILNIQVTPPR
jgi:hypothetical protein